MANFKLLFFCRCIQCKILLLTASFLFLGCDYNADGPTVDDDSNGLTLSAQEIFSEVRNSYTGLAAYQDKAVLYLTYRLNGRFIQEPHPWSVAWDAENKRYSADIFGCQIRNDGKKLGCYVFDIQTGNLDNQHLLLSETQFKNLLSDSIASYFLLGQNDLPLDENEAAMSGNYFLPPTLSFLAIGNFADWILEPDQLIRLADRSIDQSNCYGLRIKKADQVFDVWIDSESGLIEQIDLPIHFLDSAILASEEVSNIELFVRFHDKSTSREFEANQFEIKNRIATKQVRKFIEIPESLSCEKIGQIVSADHLQPVRKREKESVIDLNSSVTVAFWLSGPFARELVEQIESTKISEPGIQMIVVYSNDLRSTEVQEDQNRPVDFLTRYDRKHPEQLYFDSNFRQGDSWGLKSVPIAVVIDSDSRIQYAQPVGRDRWRDELNVAVKRVVNGEDLAAEITAEYQSFLDDYHKRLANASSQYHPAHSMDNPEIKTIESELVWKNFQVEAPGEILISDRLNKIFVLNGWQTISELDFSGKLIANHRLDVPSSTAINRIRINETADSTRFAAFSMLGNRVYVFDQDWQKLTTVPSNPNTNNNVTDCQFSPENTNLYVSFLSEMGIQEFNIDSGRSQQLTNGPVKSFISLRGALVRIADEQILIGERKLNGFEGKPIAIQAHNQKNQFIAMIGESPSQPNFLMGFSASGDKIWSSILPAKRQVTDTRYFGPSATEGDLFAFSLRSDHIGILNTDNGVVNQIDYPNRFKSVATIRARNKLKIVLATTDSVVCLVANYAAKAQPVSFRKN